MKTRKIINTLKRGEIYDALKIIKMGSLVPLLRHQLENNVEFAELSFEDRIGLIVYEAREQYLARQLNRIYDKGNHTKPVGAQRSEISYKPERNLNREVVKTLLDMDWVKGPRPYYVTISGESGTGKSYLTEVLIREACAQGLSVGYYDFCSLLKLAEGVSSEGDIDKIFNALNRKGLLVIEDFGLFNATEAGIKLIFRLIDRRYGSGAILMTSQYKVDDWYSYFAGEQNDKAVADAIMDRLRNNSINIELKGPSLRTNKVPK